MGKNKHIERLNELMKERGTYSLEALPNKCIGLLLTTKEGEEKQVIIRKREYMDIYLMDIIDFLCVS